MFPLYQDSNIHTIERIEEYLSYNDLSIVNINNREEIQTKIKDLIFKKWVKHV